MFHMPMSSPQRMRMFGLLVFAISISFFGWQFQIDFRSVFASFAQQHN